MKFKFSELENIDYELKLSDPDFFFFAFDKLPIEIKILVAQHCSIHQLLHAKTVSKAWYNIFTDPQAWQQQLKSYQKHIQTQFSMP